MLVVDDVVVAGLLSSFLLLCCFVVVVADFCFFALCCCSLLACLAAVVVRFFLAGRRADAKPLSRSVGCAISQPDNHKTDGPHTTRRRRRQTAANQKKSTASTAERSRSDRKISIHRIHTAALLVFFFFESDLQVQSPPHRIRSLGPS